MLPGFQIYQESRRFLLGAFNTLGLENYQRII